MSAIHSPFSSPLITSNFCSVLLFVTSFSLRIALGNVGIHFLFRDKSSVVEGETTLAAWLSTHTPDG